MRFVVGGFGFGFGFVIYYLVFGKYLYFLIFVYRIGKIIKFFFEVWGK